MMSIQIVQIMIVLSFIYSIRMRIWRTSLNTFIVISTMFLLTVTREIPYLRNMWVDYHVTVIGIMLFAIMFRVVLQSIIRKYKSCWCHDCTNYNRRSTDVK